jgi:hypothetical protein
MSARSDVELVVLSVKLEVWANVLPGYVGWLSLLDRRR